MKRRSLATGKLGLLATPLVAAALALALPACGRFAPGSSPASGSAPAPGGSSATASSPAPGNSPAPGSSSVPGNNPAASGNSAPSGDSGASPDLAQFCLTWQLTAPFFVPDFAVLGNDPSYDMSTPALLFRIAAAGIGGDLRTADKAAPAAVSADMNTLMNYWNAIYADFQYQTSVNENVTVAQVKADIQAHPPAQSATVGPAVQDLSGFLAANCSVNLSS